MNDHSPNPITDVEPTLDLPAYLERIGYEGPLSPTQDVLAALHLAHATHIPFENLDILLGRRIELGLDRLQAKLVSGRRGGYCFEQNLLLDAVLGTLGFSVRKLAARVRLGTDRILPRTHTLLRVETEKGSVIADVGFGMEGLLLPVPLVDGHESLQFGWMYRLLQQEDLWLMQALQEGQWRDLYAFTLEAQERIDYEVGNFYVSTHPASRFVRTLTAQRLTPSVRYLLRDFEFEERAADGRKTRNLGSEEERLRVLDETFGLQFPPGTRFRTGS
jgi:N-hydroxyarylamine O-acetyltransferase